MEGLKHAVSTVPIPGAPPQLSRNGASVGLAFLDTALRLNHVRRLTERLSVVEHGTARRVTEVDVSLRMLDESQRDAAWSARDLIGRDHRERNETSTSERAMWVPIARLSRESAAPSYITDGVGRKLPRLTQYETSRLLASGLYRLLRGILASHEDAHLPNADLSRFLFKVHEPRWLIQQALLTLLTERSNPVSGYSFARTPDTVRGHGQQCREFALQLLDHYRDALVEYAELLDIAVHDYLLVVALDDSVDEHVLTYETPLHVRHDPGRLRETMWRLTAARRGYVVGYEATFPASLNSYYLVAQTSPEVNIAHMYLSTDADEGVVHGLRKDLSSLAAKRERDDRDSPSMATHKIVELEALTVLRTLANLLRRRKWEAGQAHLEITEQTLPACHLLAAAATNGEAVRSGSGVDNSLLRNPNVTLANLRAAERELAETQLGKDLVLVKNLTDHEVHAYWRRSGQLRTGGGQVRVHAGLVLTDSTDAGPSGMVWYAAAVATTVYVLGVMLTRTLFPFGAAATTALGAIGDGQSVITVLLLVPGFLYTRLTLPPRRSIVGYLRSLSRTIGQLCIVCTAALAAAVATRSDGHLIQVFLTAGVVLPLLSIPLLMQYRPLGRSTFALTRIGAPKWVRNGSRTSGRALTPNVRFYTSGSRS
jgi:hypothetical protein